MNGDFRINDWLVQPNANSVEKNGQVWHLEPKMMHVLVELALHRNEVLSKDRLLEVVWKNTFVGEDALVRCISEIRNVFRDDPRSSRIIQTIPKSGYRLVASVTPEIGSAITHAVDGRIEWENPSETEAEQSELSQEPFGQKTNRHNGESASKESPEADGLPNPQTSFSVPPTESGSSANIPGTCRRLAEPFARTKVTITLIVVLLAFIGVLAYFWKALHQSPVDAFWDPVLADNGPVLVCLADQLQNQELTLRDASDPRRLIPLPVNLASVVLDDLQPLTQVISVLQARKKSYELKGEGAVNFNDLQTGSVVVIGAYDNAWTLRLTGRLRFHFWNSPDMMQQRIIDSSNPAQTRWLNDRSGQQSSASYRDYALVARFIDGETGRWVVAIGGIGSGGTIAAGKFVTDASQLAQLERAAQAAGGKRNMEAVISTEVIEGHSGSSKIEATYFW